MLEIGGDDIANLSDVDLRKLIGLLCEAELRSNKIPPAGVTWGGHHNAKDGGVDVRVDVSSELNADSFIPKSKTVFQVKKPDMPRAEILKEMCPNGELKEVIKELIEFKGAYIIISSQGSTADSALRNRKEAMVEAISNEPNYRNLIVDFYDRERVAVWVRSHPSIILWVREKIGRPIQGWRPHDNWANCPLGVTEEYLIDEDVRLYKGYGSNKQGLNIIDGINELRKILQVAKTSIRLVGLSGVGKTRFLQTLFDERLGDSVLNQSIVFYTDMNNAPNPDPIGMAERLVSYQINFILAIDNCPPDLHRKLSDICKKSDSMVSLITIEYDVKEDQPEETDIFSLEPSSLELIEKIILKRFNYLTEIGARRIADFSGGNARVAIALSRTVEKGEDLSGLKDNELFNRLFHQRNEPNSSLMKTAEICSLVYSFNIETGQNSELDFLSNLAYINVHDMYRDISELLRRDLVQKRHIWRAVLPHAIANRLAIRALENIPIDVICSEFENNTSERLLKSFSRRLSYLHESQEAKKIANRWLKEDGYLGDLSKFDELKLNLFENIAPLNLELALSSIEKAANLNVNFSSRENKFYYEYTQLLRAIAYESHLFISSTNLICKFALTEKPKENYNSIRSLLKSLFYIYLSGTHATAEQRLSIINNLINSDIEEEVDLGISLLDAALETTSFSSSYRFEFGARVRDYGYEPKNRFEIKSWYKLFIEYALDIAISQTPKAKKIKQLLALNFRGLWNHAGMYDELENFVISVAINDTWREGWVAILNTIKYDNDKMDSDILNRLKGLESFLQPKTLIEQAEFYALSGDSYYDLLDTLGEREEGYDLVVKKVQELGAQVGLEDDKLIILLPKLLENSGPGIFDFGKGLAEGCKNPEKTWQIICDYLSCTDEEMCNYQLLRGYLNGLSEINRELTNKLLDQALIEPTLAPIYPVLQTGLKILAEDVQRLIKSLEIGQAKVWLYSNLAYGRAHETISDDNLVEIIRLLLEKENGLDVAIEILSMRFHRIEKAEYLSDSLIMTGQELLTYYPFNRENKSNSDYKLAGIVKLCYQGEVYRTATKELCEKLFEAYTTYKIYSFDYQTVLSALAKTQSEIFLDVFLNNSIGVLKRSISQILIEQNVIISCIDESIIKKWIEVDSKNRTPLIAAVIHPYKQASNEGGLEWHPLAKWMLESYYDPTKILKIFKLSFFPSSWSGSYAESLSKFLPLISSLKNHSDSSIIQWAVNEEIEFEKYIQEQRDTELQREKKMNERFE